MKIQLLYFRGCPNVDASRVALREALSAEQFDQIDEIDVEDPAAPEWARGWGSPTILIDGNDVAGQSPSTLPTCRLYADGAPSVTAIRERIAASRVEDGRVSAERQPSCRTGDLLAGRLAWLVWCLPATLIAVGIVLPRARPALWIPSFAVMGVGCLVNARRCGRLHCHLTGPLFLFGAVAITLDTLALASFGSKLILVIVATGAILAYALEWMRGKYVETSQTR